MACKHSGFWTEGFDDELGVEVIRHYLPQYEYEIREREKPGSGCHFDVAMCVSFGGQTDIYHARLF